MCLLHLHVYDSDYPDKVGLEVLGDIMSSMSAPPPVFHTLLPASCTAIFN